MAATDVLHQGWLAKRGPDPGHSWKQRFCVLNAQQEFLVFRDQSCAEQLSKAEILPCTSATPFSVTTVNGDASKYKGEVPHGFVLDPKGVDGGRSRRLHYFDAGNAKDLSRWTSAISNAVVMSTGRESHNIDSNAQSAFAIEIKERFRNMRTAFLKVDLDRDGKISEKELLQMCKQWHVPESEARRVLKAADLNADGTLSFSEFAKRFDPDDSEVLEPLSPATDARVAARPIHAMGPRDGFATTASAAKCSECAALLNKIADLKGRLAAADATMAEQADRITELESHLARFGEAERAERSDTSSVVQEVVDSEQAARESRMVFVYGRSGCRKTAGMCTALTKGRIPFERRDFDKEKQYTEMLRASGFRGSPAPAPPIVCLGSRAWWDEGPSGGREELIPYSFAGTVVAELRRLLGITAPPAAERTLRVDASIETEIYERFRSMQEAFLKIDRNQDGSIALQELLAMCKAWNIPTSEAERSLHEADKDMNGVLSFAEFSQHFGFGPRARGEKAAAPQR